MSKQVYVYDPANEKRDDVLANMCGAVERAGKKLQIIVKEVVRSNPQNALFHVYCQAFADQLEWAGKKWPADFWKRMLVDVWCKETGRESSVIVPSIDNRTFLQYHERTRELTKAEFNELIPCVEAWAAEMGVKLPPPKAKGWMEEWA